MEKGQFFVLITATVLAVFLGGWAVYFWQSSACKKESLAFSKEIQALNDKLAREKEAVAEVKAQMAKVLEEKLALELELRGLVEEKGRYIRVVAPNGYESLCLGETFNLEWESAGIDAVTIRIQRYRGAGTDYFSLGVFPAENREEGKIYRGSFAWKVGDVAKKTVLVEDYSYKIEVISSDGGLLVSDASDGVFSILKCN